MILFYIFLFTFSNRLRHNWEQNYFLCQIVDTRTTKPPDSQRKLQKFNVIVTNNLYRARGLNFKEIIYQLIYSTDWTFSLRSNTMFSSLERFFLTERKIDVEIFHAAHVVEWKIKGNKCAYSNILFMFIYLSQCAFCLLWFFCRYRLSLTYVFFCVRVQKAKKKYEFQLRKLCIMESYHWKKRIMKMFCRF